MKNGKEQRSTGACKKNVPLSCWAPSDENGCVHDVLMIYPFWEDNKIILYICIAKLKLPAIDIYN